MVKLRMILVGVVSALMLTLSAGVALAAVLSGTNGDDRLYGGRESDVIYGKGGNDTLGGQRGSDVVYGGPGNDFLADLGGDDVLYGGTGNDFLFGDDVLQGEGGKGNDKLFGGKGRDGLAGGEGKDILYGQQGPDRLVADIGPDIVFGGSGNDVIGSQNRSRDKVFCGSGTDRVFADRSDFVAGDCERVTVASNSLASEFDEFLPEAQKVLDTLKWTGS